MNSKEIKYIFISPHSGNHELLCCTSISRVSNLYRRIKNEFFDWFMYRARSKYIDYIVEREYIGTMIKRYIKNKVSIGLLPDQDYGNKVSEFVPFFGVQAATVKSTVKLSKIYNSKLCFVSVKRYGYRYNVKFKLITDIPSGDDIKDLTYINKLIEEDIRITPEQYIWVHRRFKTQPDKPKSYLYNIKYKNLH